MEINITKIFGECFQDETAANVLARILSREPEATRDKIIIEIAKATGIKGGDWRQRIFALGSRKK